MVGNKMSILFPFFVPSERVGKTHQERRRQEVFDPMSAAQHSVIPRCSLP